MNIIIFTDGACSGNPGPGGWGAVIVTPEGEVTEMGSGERATTNNRMEMTAVLIPLRKLAAVSGAITIYTDSTYVINGITKWVWGWRNRDWKTAEGKEVSNTDLWKALMVEVAKRGKTNPIEWKYVRGHAGVPGNERADEISVCYTKGRPLSLYQGPLLKYEIPIMDLPEDQSVPEMKSRGTEPKEKAYSYVSLVNGKPMRHSNWSACEAQVKGRPGAKFKKTRDAQDEIAILRSWGVDPSKVS